MSPKYMMVSGRGPLVTAAEDACNLSPRMTMKKPTPFATVLLLSLCALVFAGCDRGDSAGGGGSGSGSTTSTTGPDGGATAGVPQVGKPAATAETYKPVVGKYGGRMVRGQLGEPKSFNPIVSSETSTSDYTIRMFEGLTRANPFTGA